MPGNWFCETTKVIKSVKHPNADSLSVITLFSDYQVVTRLDEFKEGDMVAYFAVDSILPDKPEFSFIDSKSRKRLRAKRLRGVFSMGLAIKAPDGFNEGDSVVEHYGITRYIPLEERDGYKERAKDGFFVNGTNGLNEKNPIGWSIPYYDLEPLRKYSKNLIDGEQVFITEKIHGQAISFLYSSKDEKYYVKSRNFYKKEEQNSQWWDCILRENYKEKMYKEPDKIFMGEYYGNNPGPFRYDCKINNSIVERKIRIYDIYDLNTKSFLNYTDKEKICKNLGFDMVPLIYNGEWKSNDYLYYLAENNSVIGPGLSEGFVVEPAEQRFVNNIRVKYKLISQRYLIEK